jgi:hypothetical protein
MNTLKTYPMSKKTILFTTGLLIIGIIANAQTNEPTKKVRIKTSENINGNVFETDTTFETTEDFDWHDHAGEMNINIEIDSSFSDGNGNHFIKSFEKIMTVGDHEFRSMENGDTTAKCHMMWVTDPGSEEDVKIEKDIDDEGNIFIKKTNKDGTVSEMKIEKLVDDQGNFTMKVTEDGKEMNHNENVLIMAYPKNGNAKKCNREMIIEGGEEGNVFKHETIVESSGEMGTTKTNVIVIMTRISKEDHEQLETPALKAIEGKEELNPIDLKFYPNPNDGKFNLSFSLENKGKTEINIIDMQGKQIYNEVLRNFSGQFSKDIDISDAGKGVYFIQIIQGKQATAKKIVIQ